MKPIIGVTPDFNAGDRKEWGGREPTYFLRARYIRAIEELGGVPLVLPLLTDRATRRRLLQQIDGLLLTGSGPDLPPSLYGERQRYPFEVVSERRASFELDAVHLAQQADVPLLHLRRHAGHERRLWRQSISGYPVPNLKAAPTPPTDSCDTPQSYRHRHTRQPPPSHRAVGVNAGE